MNVDGAWTVGLDMHLLEARLVFMCVIFLPICNIDTLVYYLFSIHISY